MHRSLGLVRCCCWLTFLLLPTVTALGQLSPRFHPPADTTRQALFSIPFYVNANGPPPGEVRLYVSADAARTWTLYQTRQPQQAKFDFQAGRDGEYWFVVRTNDDRDLPSSETLPEKIVIVDREEPALALEVKLGETGQLKAKYRAEDANLDPGSLKVEYRLNDTEPWQPVPVDRIGPLEKGARGLLEGETSWAISQQPELVHVRGEVVDRGGNRRGTQMSLDLRPQSAPPAPLIGNDLQSGWMQQSAAPPTPPLLDTQRLPWLEGFANTATAPESPTHTPTDANGVTAGLDSSGWRSGAALPDQAPLAAPVANATADTSTPPAASIQTPPEVEHSIPTPSPASPKPVIQMTKSRRLIWIMTLLKLGQREWHVSSCGSRKTKATRGDRLAWTGICKVRFWWKSTVRERLDFVS